ncbi:MAG: hypothetical protein KDK39_16625 [Leptospiraceae bacterium]|nr:hypothetical protein [Leptospiraceae bacterium]
MQSDLLKEYKNYLTSYQAQRVYNQNTNQEHKVARAVISGDSIAGLFRPHLLQSYLRPFNIINTGVGGDTSDLFLTRLQEDVLQYQPRVVILSIGGNDLLRRRCLDGILQRVDQILTVIHNARPDLPVLLTSVPPVYEKRLNSIILFFNLQMQYRVQNHPNVYYIDLWSRLSDPKTARLQERYWIELPGLRVDSVHFNAEGYRQWADLLKPWLVRFKAGPAS